MGENVLVGAQDLASVTQVEHCALHLTHVLYLSDRRLAALRRRRGKNLVDICTDCTVSDCNLQVYKERGIYNTAGWGNNRKG